MTNYNAQIEQIKTASSSSTALRIRGGGSKDFYGQSLQGDLLDTRALNGIDSYEPSELVVTVRAGTPLAELETVLAQQGQCLPFEPPHFQFSSQAEQATVLLADPRWNIANSARFVIFLHRTKSTKIPVEPLATFAKLRSSTGGSGLAI